MSFPVYKENGKLLSMILTVLRLLASILISELAGSILYKLEI